MRVVLLYERFGTTGRVHHNRQLGRVRLAERPDGLEGFRSSEDGDYWVRSEPGEAVDTPLAYQGTLAFEGACEKWTQYPTRSIADSCKPIQAACRSEPRGGQQVGTGETHTEGPRPTR